ncbi:Nn.00g024110.m01.CDS01 [Neocucurbitaria sp. VM-36]
MSGLPFAGGPLNGPRGKIPYVEIITLGSPSEWVADTSLITKDFIARDLLQDLNIKLSGKEVGQDLALRALLEDKLFFYNIHERWINNYYTMRDYTLAKVPFPQRLLDQGTGRFSDEEIHSFRKEIWAGVNGILEDSRKKAKAGECFWVLGGDRPTDADTSMYGFAVSALISGAGPMSRGLVKSACPEVVEYATRIHQQYFPDYEIWD